MRKSLAIVCLTLGLLGLGCDDDGDSPSPDARPDAADGGTDGSKDLVSDMVARPDVPADGGDASDLNSEVGPETTSETGPDLGPDLGPDVPAGPTTWTSCVDPKNGVSVEDFCAQYSTVCSFDPAGGSAMAERYKSAEDCRAKYLVGSPARRGCVAYHLCAASQDATAKAMHCPHPPQASLPVPMGPGPCGNM